MELPLNPDFPYYLAEADFVELGDQFRRSGGVDWSRFLFFAEELSVSPGDHLIRQFDCDATIYILTHGELDVRVAATPGGEEQSIATVEPITVIGEQSFLDDGPRTASVIAKNRSTVYRLSREAFEEMRDREPAVAWAFLLDVAASLSRRSRMLLAKQAGL
jgi:CRP/FNR family transcriptional regulator, cyclic AMP receptor protein